MGLKGLCRLGLLFNSYHRCDVVYLLPIPCRRFSGLSTNADYPAACTTTTLKLKLKHSSIRRNRVLCSFTSPATMEKDSSSRPSSDMAKFREHFGKAKHIVVLTGAGISAESGVPTFRGEGGLWRNFNIQKVATPEAFHANPSKVWELYHYRREIMRTKHPNPAHIAIAECEQRFEKQGRRVVVITQNIDELHKAAGSKNILELHGSLFRTRCSKCGDININRHSPICPALKGKGAPDGKDAKIPIAELPHCKTGGCNGLLRPDVVWFGESLDREVMDKAHQEVEACDLCLVVGTSAVVYPAAMFGPLVSLRGVPVAEFNLEVTPNTGEFGFMFQGKAGEILPEALAPHEKETP